MWMTRSTGKISAGMLLLLAALATASKPAFSQEVTGSAAGIAREGGLDPSAARIDGGTLARVEFEDRVHWARVPAGTVLNAKLSMPLYASQRPALPAGTALRLTIQSSERVRGHQGFWPRWGGAFARAFNPLARSQAPQYRVTLSGCELLLPDGEWLPVQASVLRASSAFVVAPQPRGTRQTPDAEMDMEQESPSKGKPAPALVLQFTQEVPLPSPGASDSAPNGNARRSAARAFLLTALNASNNQEGDGFQAQLAEPVLLGDRVFEPGSLVHGTVVRRTPPRTLSRAGLLHLRVDQITASNGETLYVSGRLTRAEADAPTRLVMDEEGTLRGRKPGVGNGLVDLGMSYAIGKATDDIAETPIRAIGASMSDAAVANAARYFGLASAAAYLILRHGRDVRLPQYAEVEFDFGRVQQSAPLVPAP